MYVNGNEIHRFNMPTGVVNYQTFSTGEVANAGWSPTEGAYFPSLANTLQGGENVLAAEVHQSDNNSPDICFGLEFSITAPSFVPTPCDFTPPLKLTRLSDQTAPHLVIPSIWAL